MAPFTDEPRRTPSQVGAIYGVHVATVWRWMQRGVRGRRLRSIRIGGRRFILESDLRDFLAPTPADEQLAAPPAAAINSIHGAASDELTDASVDEKLDAAGL